MDNQPTMNSGRIRVEDAIDLFFKGTSVAGSICDDFKAQVIDRLKQTGIPESGITFGDYSLEIYEGGAEYYLDAAAFSYALTQIRQDRVKDHCANGSINEEN
jgi:hypothetical protein